MIVIIMPAECFYQSDFIRRKFKALDCCIEGATLDMYLFEYGDTKPTYNATL